MPKYFAIIRELDSDAKIFIFFAATQMPSSSLVQATVPTSRNRKTAHAAALSHLRGSNLPTIHPNSQGKGVQNSRHYTLVKVTKRVRRCNDPVPSWTWSAARREISEPRAAPVSGPDLSLYGWPHNRYGSTHYSMTNAMGIIPESQNGLLLRVLPSGGRRRNAQFASGKLSLISYCTQSIMDG